MRNVRNGAQVATSQEVRNAKLVQIFTTKKCEMRNLCKLAKYEMRNAKRAKPSVSKGVLYRRGLVYKILTPRPGTH